MTNRIKLFALSTPETAALERIFLNSIKDNWDVEVTRRPSFGNGNGDFHSESYFKALSFKMQWTENLIGANLGRTIILSDIDIEFFRPCERIVRAKLENCDAIFQSEYWPSDGTVNSGFVALNCNGNTLAFWKEVNSYPAKDFPFGDQSIINMLLRKKECQLAWDVLPNAIYAQSHRLWPLSIALYHANCTVGKDSINQKLRQLGAVRARVMNERALACRMLSLLRGIMRRALLRGMTQIASLK
jgi:hypothetical protein